MTSRRQVLGWVAGTAAAALAPQGAQAQAGARAAQRLGVRGTLAGPDRLGLSWDASGSGAAVLLRRPLASPGRAAWSPVEGAHVDPRRALDPAMPPGTAWEYQVRLTARDGTLAAGQWVAGRDVPAEALRGAGLIVVDETLADGLADRLARLEADWRAEGWRVAVISGPRAPDDPGDGAEVLRRAAMLRAIIGDWHAADPFAADHAILLLGHLPVPRSGWANPDGHDPQAHPTDLFYADPHGQWRPGRRPDGRVQLAPSRLPTAGGIAAMIGRVDLAAMPDAFAPEPALLAAYLDRNHAFRRGDLGDPRGCYGRSDHLLVERDGLANIAGAAGVADRGHHDAGYGPDGPGGPPWLAGVDFGSHAPARYAPGEPVASPVFAINFGSGKQVFDARGNTMRALLAAPNGTLAVGWGGRPSWQLHGLALGECIGAVHRRTAVNGAASLPGAGPAARDYPVTGDYDWTAPVWVALLGDPTLRPFPLAPATGLALASDGAGGRVLRWTLPASADGARILGGPGPDGPWRPLQAEPVRGTQASLPAGPDAPAAVMVRAEGGTETGAGTLRRLAPGTMIASPSD